MYLLKHSVAQIALLLLCLSSGVYAQSNDIDNDGVPNELDLDADNDAIPNVFEGTVDTDRDGLPDYLDLDADNDTIPDMRESILNRSLLLMIDTNGDGLVDAGNAIGDDGLVDVIEVLMLSENINFRLPDSDRDGVLNFRDLDSDNDGLSDRIELRNLVDFVLPSIVNINDGNRNGIDDTVTPLTAFFDADGDLAENAYDLDSDNDGLSDLLETAGVSADSDNNGQFDQFFDQDGNGLADALQNSPLQARDFDNDGVPNHLDLDSDNDGIFDIDEFLQTSATSVNTTTADTTPVNVSTNDDQPMETPASLNTSVTANDNAGGGNLDSDLLDSNSGSGLAASDTEIAQTILTSGISGSAIGGCSIAYTRTQQGWSGAMEWLLLLAAIAGLRYATARRPLALNTTVNDN